MNLHNSKYLLSRTLEDVHLILPPHIFSVQVKSGACYITGQWDPSSEQNKKNLTPTLTLTIHLLLPSIVFHNAICFFVVIFTALSFLYEEVMSVRLYALCQCPISITQWSALVLKIALLARHLLNNYEWIDPLCGFIWCNNNSTVQQHSTLAECKLELL